MFLALDGVQPITDAERDFCALVRPELVALGNAQLDEIARTEDQLNLLLYQHLPKVLNCVRSRVTIETKCDAPLGQSTNHNIQKYFVCEVLKVFGGHFH